MTTYQNLINEGKTKGIEQGIERSVINIFKKSYSVEQIAALMDLPLEKVRLIIEKYLKSQGHKS
jgi:predicted transposase YdaD